MPAAARSTAFLDKACQLANADIQAQREEFLFQIPGVWLRSKAVALLNDPRDAPLLYLLWDILVTTVLMASLMHALKLEYHLLGVGYLLVNYVLYGRRFMLTLHFAEHRRLFRQGWLNQVTPYLLAPLFGVPSGAYRLHHVVMHHIEDNAGGWDLSSTEPYQRDRIPHFLHYWLRFFLLGHIELPLYAARRGRYAEAAVAATTMTGQWLLVWLLARRCWVATLYTFVLPWVVASFALMLGNWSQHVFVNPDSPADDYSLTYNCLCCHDNVTTYNDGYHIQHHANSRLHWSELPSAFVKQLQLHDDKDALVFERIGPFDVGVAVFSGRLGWLAEHVVPCGPRQAARSKEEWVALLQRRLQPVVRASCKVA